ncbi:Protein of unknown function [Nakamurella panacisegetis]|uniref:DUF2510 domain-containing protein n=1 Tax=Nakamurella panacisegetis TaxID=1090615 RepID=A0A1H0JSQ2_9ACTN|nr:DUF2510 domain-containing protein [Nakamurella panacisegetis]SDO46756.1 Protein of unknown function [Nakamurella panacisegetis]
MTAPVAGWYADPNGSTDLRFWDGAAWTPSTQPAPAAQSPYPNPGQPYPAQPYVGQPYPGQPDLGRYAGQPYPGQPYPAQPTRLSAPAAGLLARSRFTLITIAVCIVYYIIERSAHIVFFGVLPVVMTARSFQAKEPYAIIGAAIAAVTIVNAFAHIF